MTSLEDLKRRFWDWAKLGNVHPFSLMQKMLKAIEERDTELSRIEDEYDQQIDVMRKEFKERDKELKKTRQLVSQAITDEHKVRVDLLKAQKEIERLRDWQAAWQADLLEQFDRDAAQSTDLYTYIKCLQADCDRWKRKALEQTDG